ncbi:MAG: hypothetical protein KAI94_13185 [Anaerolineales bacterium]|nr:hypothetical protein [Anaerolineales bacterium]
MGLFNFPAWSQQRAGEEQVAFVLDIIVGQIHPPPAANESLVARTPYCGQISLRIHIQLLERSFSGQRWSRNPDPGYSLKLPVVLNLNQAILTV